MHFLENTVNFMIKTIGKEMSVPAWKALAIMFKCSRAILYIQHLSNSFPDSDGSAPNKEKQWSLFISFSLVRQV